MSDAIVDVSLIYSDDSENSKEFVYGECIGEIVRCQDCKHSYHTLVGDSESDCRVALACSELDDREVDPDWFCADGEKREDDDLLMCANHDGERREE